MTIHCEPNHGLAQTLRNLSENFGVIIMRDLTNGQHIKVERSEIIGLTAWTMARARLAGSPD